MLPTLALMLAMTDGFSLQEVPEKGVIQHLSVVFAVCVSQQHFEPCRQKMLHVS